jgi:lipopolysaccharide transport system ATP-binding protein
VQNNETVIRVESLSKRYLIGHETAHSQTYHSLRETIVRHAMNFGRKALDVARGHVVIQGDVVEEFWALQDVSFEVRRGEVMGIVGRNGAGKSTLLKVLSRITEPTKGRVTIHGRVASLLEVGTGFHPELTGRENIYLNGAILGMRRAEIRAKFDEIVDFAEIETFLDTPVKRYSSGMYVRLAFAVAAHLEPEILIVDEVLAVGDVVFQEKCLGKMQEVSRSAGRTVLFVSHNMGAIQSLCRRGMVLEQGRNAFTGNVEEAVRFYFARTNLKSATQDFDNRLRTGTGEARVLSVRLEDDAGVPRTNYSMGESLNIAVRVDFLYEVHNPTFGVNIVTDAGLMVAACYSSHYGLRVGSTKGMVEYRMRIESVTLYPRTYLVEPWVADAGCLSDFDWVQNAAAFHITSGPTFLSGANLNSKHGVSFIPTSWTFAKV